MKKKQQKTKTLLRKVGLGLLGAVVASNLVSCMSTGLHNGRIPFSLMEKPQSKRKAMKNSSKEVKKMTEVMTYVAKTNEGQFRSKRDQLEIGDIVTFYMGHKESWQHLKKGKIQKVPYDLFRYGHLALVVENPDKEGGKRLLQLAMKQKVNTESDLSYLKDKNWKVFRPEKIDRSKLREFVQIASERGSSEKKAYDYSGAFGVKNAAYKPKSKEEIGDEYTCCTLIVAALYYSGYELHSTKRGGILDIVTPRQVVESWGNMR